MAPSVPVSPLSSVTDLSLSTLLRPVDLSRDVGSNDLVLTDLFSTNLFLPASPVAATALVAAAPPTTAEPEPLMLAQQLDQDILGDMGQVWNNFIESGQVWALIIGIVLGYLVRGLTAY